MKRFLLFVIAASWFCTAFCADTFKIGSLTYKKLNSSSVEIVGCSSSATEELIILPIVKESSSSSTLYNVVSIGEWAFKYCTMLTSIVIPNSVTSIGRYAFRECYRLISVVIPNSVTSIGDGAFQDCDGLTSAEIPNSVTSIGYGAFEGCTGLTSVVIPSSVTSIGYGAFEGCTGLTSVVIPSSVTSIGVAAFEGCTGLTSVVIPSSITSIGGEAFRGCSGLTSIEIPNSVTSIRNFTFEGCTGLTSVVIPSSVTSIGDEAFRGCSGLTSIEIPNSVTSIGVAAFRGCPGLTSIVVVKDNTAFDSRENCNALIETKSNKLVVGCKNTEIPNSVTSLGEFAFDGCTGLTSIEIPNSVTSIGYYAFSNCNNLNKIVCYAPMPPAVQESTFQNVSKNASVYVICNSIEYYKIYWDYFNKDSFKCIGADPIDGEISGTVVDPTATSAVLKWELEAGANKYTFVITKGGVTVCTLTISSDGKLISIEYPNTASTRGAELRNANVTVKGYSFEVDGLEPETTYQYTMNALNSSGGVIKTYTGEFTTLKMPVSVDEYDADANVTLKEKVSISGRKVSVSGVEASDIKIYNTAGQQVGNPVPSAGVYVVTVGKESAKILVK